MNASTHEVFNQSTPFSDVDLYACNVGLRDALRFNAPKLDRKATAAKAALVALGQLVGRADMQAHARLANQHPPELRTHDRVGNRIDQVEFHPSYHLLMQAAMAQGLHATPWLGRPGAHVHRAAGFMLYTELEASVLCPISMTYAAVGALRANTRLAASWLPGLAATEYDSRFAPPAQKTALTMGMGMTEKQGGSDVRANTTQAMRLGKDAWGEAYALRGHKWFMSAPMCDAFMVLAQAKAGLSCFFLPRWLPDGRVNALHIQRLKDKLGNKANASSEVEFHDAVGWLVGDEGRGVQQILAMGTLTRLDCALGTAGLMRHALSLAVHHTRERSAFGKRLAEQPMMKAVLADLALESEAATALSMRLARAVDRSEHDAADAHEAAVRRVLTPLAKFWVCKRGSAFAQEAMECLGGNGYVEDGGRGVMARIYREMPLNAIWEGASNIMGLDLLRALRDPETILALMTELAPLAGAHAAVDRQLRALPDRLDGGTDEAQARALARDAALLWQASLLRQHAPDFVFDAFCASRLLNACDVFGAMPAGVDVNPILQRALP